MTEKGKITMSEFKTVVERFEENQKRIIEVMNYRFDKVETDIHAIKQDVSIVKQDVFILKQDVTVLKQDVSELKQDNSTLKQEVALLHEGQTAIRSDLRRKVSYDDFDRLEKRVARLECKAA